MSGQENNARSLLESRTVDSGVSQNRINQVSTQMIGMFGNSSNQNYSRSITNNNGLSGISNTKNLLAENKVSITTEQPVETLVFRSEFAKRPEPYQLNKKDLKFDFERPPVHRIGNNQNIFGLSQHQPNEQNVESIEVNNNFIKRTGPSPIYKKDLQFDFEGPPKSGVKVQSQPTELPQRVVTGGLINPVTESFTADARFTRRTDVSQIDKKNLKFDFEGPPRIDVRVKGRDPRIPLEMTNNETPIGQIEEIQINQNFVHRPDASKLDKKGLQFDFEALPRRHINVKGNQDFPNQNTQQPEAPLEQVAEQINFDYSFNKRSDAAHIDKKDLQFDFQKPPSYNRSVRGGNNQLPEEIVTGADPELPTEHLEINESFNKRSDQSKLDKSKLQFDFKAPQKIGKPQNNLNNNLNFSQQQTSVDSRNINNSQFTVVDRNVNSYPSSQINNSNVYSTNNNAFGNINSHNIVVSSETKNRQIIVTSKHNATGSYADIEVALRNKFGELFVREEKNNFKVYRVSTNNDQRNDKAESYPMQKLNQGFSNAQYYGISERRRI